MIQSINLSIISLLRVASLFLTLVILSPHTAQAEMYKLVDDQGKTQFTDSQSKIPSKYRPKENQPPPPITHKLSPSDCDAGKIRGQYVLRASGFRYAFLEPDKSELPTHYLNEFGREVRPPSCSVLEALIINRSTLSEAKWREIYVGKSIEGKGPINIPIPKDGTVKIWAWVKNKKDASHKSSEWWRLDMVVKVKDPSEINKINNGETVHYYGKITHFRIHRYKRKHEGVINQKTDYLLYLDGHVSNGP